jgi:DNA polymerase-3 subunit epsilon
MKAMYFDVETTGTDEKKHGILQLAGLNEIDETFAEGFNLFMKPFPNKEITDRALEANGITREQIETFETPTKVYEKLIDILDRYIDRYDKTDKFTLIGYNARFDDAFLRSWFADNFNAYYGSYFHWPAIDVSNMVAVKYRNWRHKFKDFKLMTVANQLGIEIDITKAHDAMYDTKVTRAIFRKLIEGSSYAHI